MNVEVNICAKDPLIGGLWFQGTTVFSVLFIVALLSGCRSASWHLQKAEDLAQDHLTRAQRLAFDREEPIEIESAKILLRERLLRDQQLPTRVGDADFKSSTKTDSELESPLPQPLVLTPEKALQVAARNNRDFQEAKETLFRAALDLDLEQAAFRQTFSSMLSGSYDDDRSGDDAVRSTHVSTESGTRRTFRSGTEMSGSIAVDLARLLTQGTASSLGILADAGVTIPLLRGAGRDIAMEPLKQAERNLLYAVYTFERFKRAFAVSVMSDYITVLQFEQQILNADQNYKSLTMATRRARRLADAGRLPEFQFDQAVQNELRARTRWIEARENHAARLDRYKIQLGLPPDADIALDATLLGKLQSQIDADSTVMSEPEKIPPADAPVELQVPEDRDTDTLGLNYPQAMVIALDSRLDLLTAQSRVEDARRRIRVAEDRLRAELTLFGSVQSGERRRVATGEDADIGFDQLRSRALLTLDLPFNRTAERLAYRRSFINLEAQKRAAAAVEDQIKQDIRRAFRDLRLSRENVRIQQEAVRLAERRVHSTDMLLQAGRAEIRDVLDAQEALIGAQNALTSAAVTYRIAELEFQRDMDTLDVSVDGILQEHYPLLAED